MTRRLTWSLTLFALVSAAAPVGSAGAQDTPISLIKVAEVSVLLKKGAKVQLVDVRSRQEYLTRHLPGALSVPLDTIETRVADISRQGLVVLY